MPGIVTLRKRCQAFVPSSWAASICSVGMPLIAALSTTIAKPVWIQIMTTISRMVLIGSVCSHCTGSPPAATTSAFSRPICSRPSERYS